MTERTTGTAELPERVLAIYAPTNPGKIERHILPLATVAETTLVCTTSNDSVDGFTQLSPPSTGIRILDLLGVFVLAALEGIRGDYDAVVSISLVPTGCFALVIGRAVGIPVHLGIIGCDIDVHAESWYGRPIRALIRRFDAITVPGPTHRRRLQEFGVPFERISILANPIDPDEYHPATDTDTDTEYDLIWVGRFSEEKQPLVFVRTVARLAEEDPSIRAVMLGDGPLTSAVDEWVRNHGLEDNLIRPGWVETPLEYYRRSSVFVLTSRRDALPLTLVETMAVGVPAVVAPVGNVPDLIEDDHNGIVVDTVTAAGFATGIRRLYENPGRYERLGANAEEIRDRFTYEAAAADWQAVLDTLARKRPAAVRHRAVAEA